MTIGAFAWGDLSDFGDLKSVESAASVFASFFITKCVFAKCLYKQIIQKDAAGELFFKSFTSLALTAQHNK